MWSWSWAEERRGDSASAAREVRSLILSVTDNKEMRERENVKALES